MKHFEGCTIYLIEPFIIFLHRKSVEYRLIAAALVGLAGWTGFIFTIRQMMKVLLRYHGSSPSSLVLVHLIEYQKLGYICSFLLQAGCTRREGQGGRCPSRRVHGPCLCSPSSGSFVHTCTPSREFFLRCPSHLLQTPVRRFAMTQPNPSSMPNQ